MSSVRPTTTTTGREASARTPFSGYPWCLPSSIMTSFLLGRAPCCVRGEGEGRQGKGDNGSSNKSQRILTVPLLWLVGLYACVQFHRKIFFDTHQRRCVRSHTEGSVVTVSCRAGVRWCRHRSRNQIQSNHWFHVDLTKQHGKTSHNKGEPGKQQGRHTQTATTRREPNHSGSTLHEPCRVVKQKFKGRD